MSEILPTEIDVNQLAVRLKDRKRVMRTLWSPGEFFPHEDHTFVKKFISIKNPIEVARRARAYVSLVRDTHLEGYPCVYTPEYTIIATRLRELGFSHEQVSDIAKTPASVDILGEEEQMVYYAGGLYD